MWVVVTFHLPPNGTRNRSQSQVGAGWHPPGSELQLRVAQLLQRGSASSTQSCCPTCTHLIAMCPAVCVLDVGVQEQEPLQHISMPLPTAQRARRRLLAQAQRAAPQPALLPGRMHPFTLGAHSSTPKKPLPPPSPVKQILPRLCAIGALRQRLQPQRLKQVLPSDMAHPLVCAEPEQQEQGHCLWCKHVGARWVRTQQCQSAR